MDENTYMVERYVPGVSADELRAAAQRASSACAEMRAGGISIRYLGSAFVPAEEACFCEFEAPSAAAVEQANERAAIPFARIVEVVRIPADEASS